MTLAFKTSGSGAARPFASRARRGGSEGGLMPLCGDRRLGSSRASLFVQTRLLSGISCRPCLF